MEHKTRIYRTVALLFIGLLSSGLSAQQHPQYSQYMYNTMTINPGYTGSLGTLDIVGMHRSQWVGIDRAPSTQNLSIHSPLNNEQIGIGLNIQNDRLGPADQFFTDANFSYALQVAPTMKLGLGLKAGARFFNVDFSKGSFQDEGDPLLQNNIDNRLTAILGAGAYLYSDKWYVGLSVPDFMRRDFYDAVDEAVAKEEMQFFLIGGYVFDLNSDLKFKPAFLAKYTSGFPIVVDVSANFLIWERLSLGLAYRYEDAFSALAGFQVFEPFFVGYGYDFSTTDFRHYNYGTHEIILRYTLPYKGRRIGTPRYF